MNESFFLLADSGSSSNKTVVVFNSCGIQNVPSKSFPSYLNTIKFVNCTVGSFSPNFIQSLKFHKVMFDSSSVGEFQTDAFYSKSLVDFFHAHNSSFGRIHRKAVASAIQHLSLTDCRLGDVDSESLSGFVGNFRIERSVINNTHPQAFLISSWTSFILVNNTFKNVMKYGIDLTTPDGVSSSKDTRPARLLGNSWINVTTDFIRTTATETPYVEVQDNVFKKLCSCEQTFASSLSLNGSRSWFHDEMFKASKCPISEKSQSCLASVTSTTVQDGYVTYSDLPQLCSPEIFMCLIEVSDIDEDDGNGTTINQGFPILQLLAYGFGALAFLIFISVVICGLCCDCKSHPKSSEKMESNDAIGNNGISCDLPRKEFVKTINPDQYAAMSHKDPNETPSLRSRVALLKDVEMEDKGVQTMPSELSAEIIEELRGKLSHTADSFWNPNKQATYTINDLDAHSDLLPSFFSPPDVTICNETNETPTTSNSNTNNLSSDSLKLLISPARRPIKLVPSSNNRGEARKSMSTFAQVPSPSSYPHPPQNLKGLKGGDPIYSELVAGHNANQVRLMSPSKSNSFPYPTQLPLSPQSTMLCEYTEPRDFNSHIYAELGNSSSSTFSPSKTNIPVTLEKHQNVATDMEGLTGDVPPPLPTSVIPQLSPGHRSNDLYFSSKLNDLNVGDRDCTVIIGVPYDPPSKNNSPKNIPSGQSTKSSKTPTGSNNPSPKKRPLPSIPSSPSISTHL